jgi:maltose alpha-D-glucosyltransferase/alpha-amylase
MKSFSCSTLLDDIFPIGLSEDMKVAIQLIYGSSVTENIYTNIAERVCAIRAQRSAELLAEDFNRPSDWYRNEIIYMFYAERFGVDEAGRPNTFKTLIPMLDYLRDLGVTALYMLPFLDSPMIDAGFDVSDYRRVRDDLGGNAEFELFLAEAKRRGFKIKADLILNHISDRHAWFRAAAQGDADKLDYFVVRETPPRYQVRHTAREGTVVVYTEADGGESHRRLVFPDIAHSHYRRERVADPNGGPERELYFYHTFYPHQLDLNWLNPAVLYEAIDLLGFWANKGVDIFRLDAIPFFVKKPGTNSESLPETHAVVKILSACLQAMAPATVIQAEACQWPCDIRPYYGEERRYALAVPGHGEKTLIRTDEVQIAYHFPWMPAIWASMVTGDPATFWEATKETPPIPASAGWAIFLRVHDELTLEMVDPQTRQVVYDALVSRGEPFRAGLGISGRLADFLDNDPRRIALIHSILLSLPGIPILYFGDEIGENNNPAFMRRAAEEREACSAGSDHLGVKTFTDTRDLGRAPIARQRFLEAAADAANEAEPPKTLAGIVLQTLKRLIRARKADDVLVKGELSRVQASDPAILAYLRTLNDEARLIVHNLSGEPRTVTLKVSAAFRKNRLLDVQSGQSATGIALASDGIQLTLDPYQSYWLNSIQ